MNYDVVCESCQSSVLQAPHIGVPEADRMAAHLRDQHRNGLDAADGLPFAELLKRFRVRMAD